jgi:tRNA(Glu) U13 pseudouridine synthase TruD
MIFPELDFNFKEKMGSIPETISLIGYDSELKDFEAEYLEKEGISEIDFINKQLPSLSVRGGERDSFFRINNCFVKQSEDDEIYNNMKKQVISFELGKGSYATVVLKHLFN